MWFWKPSNRLAGSVPSSRSCEESEAITEGSAGPLSTDSPSENLTLGLRPVAVSYPARAIFVRDS